MLDKNKKWIVLGLGILLIIISITSTANRNAEQRPSINPLFVGLLGAMAVGFMIAVLSPRLATAVQ